MTLDQPSDMTNALNRKLYLRYADNGGELTNGILIRIRWNGDKCIGPIICARGSPVSALVDDNIIKERDIHGKRNCGADGDV